MERFAPLGGLNFDFFGVLSGIFPIAAYIDGIFLIAARMQYQRYRTGGFIQHGVLFRWPCGVPLPLEH
jgi:hypothetical protein